MSELVIFGALGQVGRALSAAAAARGIGYRALSRAACDITSAQAVERNVAGASLAVNCAAFTAVDRAESQPDAARAVNAIGPANVAAACARFGIPLVQLSTDYVFDGRKAGPWTEYDPTAPLGVYGRSKLEGERAVRDRLDRHIILRTSWIFSADGENFVKTMLRLARQHTELTVVNDQIGGPTAAADIAEAIVRIASAVADPQFGAFGTYHFAGAPAVSWYEFAKAILHGRDISIRPVASRDFPWPAARPLNSVLDCGRILRVFGIRQPDWRPALKAVLDRLCVVS